MNHRKKTSLQNKKTHTPVFQRVFLSAFKKLRKPGSLTVETAVVLPLFLFAMVSLLYMNEVIRSSDIVNERLHQCARKLSGYAYAAEKASLGEALGGSLSGIALSSTYAAGDVESSLDNASALKGSFSWLYSKFMEKDIIDLVAVQDIRIPYDITGSGRMSVIDRARVHAFTGYDVNNTGGSENTGEETVYITPTGSVYHKSRNCSHLKVSPRSVSPGALESLRNSGGGKYYECEFCHKSGSSVYYVTDFGDRYHTTLECQGLKRDVRAVPLSQAGGRTPCKTCGR